MTDSDKDKLVADSAELDDFNRSIVEDFWANGGKVGGPFEGAPKHPAWVHNLRAIPLFELRA